MHNLEFRFSRLETAKRFAAATLQDMVVLQDTDKMYVVTTKRHAAKLKQRGCKVIREVNAS